MRQTLFLLGALALIVAQPLNAAETAPLAPGKPAGIKPAQADGVVSAFAPAVLLGALLAITVGVNGSSVAPSTSTTNGASCCG